MFTGLIEEVGTVRALARGAGAKLHIAARRLTTAGVHVGDSISINGACLTVVKVDGEGMVFDAVEETLAKSTLGRLKPGDLVNLERAVSAERLFGGHFVLGHVDGVGAIASFDKRAGAASLTIRAPEGVTRYVVPQGSIAVDGISLTVAACSERDFTVAIIPYTMQNTNLAARRPGDLVNIETDILGKYVEKLLSSRSAGRGVTEEMLTEAGW